MLLVNFKLKTVLTFAIWGVLTFGQSVYANNTDPHSYSNPEQVKVTDIAFNLHLNFKEKRIDGRVLLTLNRINPTAPIILDTMDLTIHSIKLLDKDGRQTPAKFELSKPNEVLGSSLTIPLNDKAQKIEIFYQSSSTAAGVQWLSAESTSSHKPFMFTQSEPIGARSWFPCQDTPQVRTTYTATVKAPIGLLAVMSATNPTKKSPTGIYHFKMEQPVPSYLIALAAGDLKFSPLGDRTGVYAEPSVLPKAEFEFAELDKIFAIAERMFGPYLWGRFDVLVMPFSFPYGGMENPRLTFVSPTTISGDRSSVFVVAHELAHSWSGNLTTNANWNEFWLNEGPTTYFERRIIEELYGTKRSEVEWALSYSELLENLDGFKDDQELTKLHTHLDERSPEDGFNGLPYNKGSFFFYELESKLGREKLDQFWRFYFGKYAFKSVTTDDFMYALSSFFDDSDLIEDLDVKTWVFEPNIPAKWAPPSFPRIKEIQVLAEDFITNRLQDSAKITALDSREQGVFLDIILSQSRLNHEQLTTIEKSFALSTSGNAELLAKWFQITIANQFTLNFPQIEKFLMTTGRMRFLVPVFKALNQTNSCQSIEFANKVYGKARASYFKVAQNRLDKLMQKCQ